MKKKVHLHIGSYKTGTTYIQEIFHNNREGLKKQGFLYPGRRVNHHHLIFASKPSIENYPRQYKGVDLRQINEMAVRYFKTLERDFKSNQNKQQVLSTEYLFVDNREQIKNTVQYLENFFSEVVIYVFLRNPVDYYTSSQQQVIKARSHIIPPSQFRYPFKNVIEGWKNYCDVHVISYDQKVNSCEILCDKIGIDFNRLSKIEKKLNTSLSIEKMALLEKIQSNLYRDSEDIYKRHLDVIHGIKINKTTDKPVLKKWVEQVVYKNHENDLEWLKKHFNIDFLNPELAKENKTNGKPDNDKDISVRNVFHNNEEQIRHFEAAVMDFLLKRMHKHIMN